MNKLKVIAAIIVTLLTVLIVIGIDHMQNADIRKCIRLSSSIPELNMTDQEIKNGCSQLKKSGELQQFNDIMEVLNDQN
jgi:hypothetical protein